MKFCLALALIICLLGCQKKETAVTVSPGLVGTYSYTYTVAKPGVFQNMLSDYTNFQETVTATVSQTGVDTYDIKIQLTGVAKKTNTPPFNYHLTADVSLIKQVNSFDKSIMAFKGEYTSIYPTSSYLSTKEIRLDTKFREGFLEDLIISTDYRNDHGIFTIISLLPKVQ